MSAACIRRLAISRQGLAGSPARADRQAMYDVVRSLGCLQLDPISTVARSHQLVLWSRLGAYAQADLEALLYEERRLFEYWAHEASIVLTEDLSLHRWLMDRYRDGQAAPHFQEWARANAGLREHLLEELQRRGPLPSRLLEDRARAPYPSTGWNAGQNVTRMLNLLLLRGEVAVSSRRGGQKFWDLWERCLPPPGEVETLAEPELTRRSARRSLRALGCATRGQIERHFVRRRYPGLPAVLEQMESEGEVIPLAALEDGRLLRGRWYLHHEDEALLQSLEQGDWEPRLTLLSPFDNLICDRSRTEELFGFRYRMEIYVPAHKRVDGYYVMPMLMGDKLQGRVEPVLERRRGRLLIRSLRLEPGVRLLRADWRALAAVIHSLAAFAGASGVACQEGIEPRLARVL